MILNDEQMIAILDVLDQKTAQHKAAWYSDGGKIWIDLPNRVTVELSRAPDDYLTASIKSSSDEILGKIDSAQPGNAENILRKLYTVASGEASRSIYREIIDAITLADTATADLVRPTLSVPAVTPEQRDRVLSKMAGQWQLNGQENATIEADRYRVNGKDPLHLVVVAVNDNEDKTLTVEVAKDLPDGRRRRIEYLKISDGSMMGNVKHDGQKLAYKRTRRWEA